MPLKPWARRSSGPTPPAPRAWSAQARARFSARAPGGRSCVAAVVAGTGPGARPNASDLAGERNRGPGPPSAQPAAGASLGLDVPYAHDCVGRIPMPRSSGPGVVQAEEGWRAAEGEPSFARRLDGSRCVPGTGPPRQPATELRLLGSSQKP